MKEDLLNYYSQFNCKAERCLHTCCKGWDMCIDEKTLKEYKNIGIYDNGTNLLLVVYNDDISNFSEVLLLADLSLVELININ